MGRLFELMTPLGTDVLLFRAMRGHEELGRLSEFRLSTLSTRSDLKPGDLLGKSVTVAVELRGGGHRHFNGIVNRFAAGGMVGRHHHYALRVQPWPWLLTRTADCRIFQDKSVPDIIRQVFADHSVGLAEYELTGHHPPREYCVQYRETDFDFVSRLMEEEGIYYYFEHADGKHVMKLVDSPAGHKELAGKPAIAFFPPGTQVRVEEEFIHAWTFAQSIQPGVMALDDYDFTKPKVDLTAKAQMLQRHENAKYEVYDWPGEYRDEAAGEWLVQARVDERHSEFERAEAECNVREIAVGRRFTLTNGPRRDQEREHLIVSADYEWRDNAFETSAEEPATYHCSFTALSSKQQFRPARSTPRPTVKGVHSAVVVGPAGEEIWTDKYGRVKVQFHWDREGKKDENSSCWIRVAQFWAGNRWGASFWPRIGQEVIVDFLEGDPDQPIIVGTVYNADQMPPYLGDGPDPKHKNDARLSGIKSNSTPGGRGFNELRFDDTKGKEQVFIHAQRSMDTRVGASHRHTVGGSYHVNIGYEDEEGGKHGDLRIKVKKDQHHWVEGDARIKIEGAQDVDIGKAVNRIFGDHVADNIASEWAVSARKIVFEATQSITLAVGGNFVEIGPAGVTVYGTLVQINCLPSARALAENTALTFQPEDPAGADTAKSGSTSSSSTRP